MAQERFLFTSESVTEGHPDKIADQISDGILDALLADDPGSRVAVETLITTGQVHVAGEVTTKAYADIPVIVRETILRIGYDSSKQGFDGASCGVSVSIGAQSPDIAQGVDHAMEQRGGQAGDVLDAQGAGGQEQSRTDKESNPYFCDHEKIPLDSNADQSKSTPKHGGFAPRRRHPLLLA